MWHLLDNLANWRVKKQCAELKATNRDLTRKLAVANAENSIQAAQLAAKNRAVAKLQLEMAQQQRSADQLLASVKDSHHRRVGALQERVEELQAALQDREAEPADSTPRRLLLERHAAYCPTWEAAEDHTADKARENGQ